jgi:type II secretory ATPase GspE/PulE/Tfp pilus assembly ATPase PilB-like protein
VGTQELKHLVRTRSPVPELVRAAQADGMRLLRQDALEKVLGGQLDLLSARAAAS